MVVSNVVQGSKSGESTARIARLHYLSNLIRMRRAISQNLNDARRTNENHNLRYMYVVDSNVMHLYFSPERNRKLTRILPPSHTRNGAQAARRNDPFVAIITAQFIFSNLLPGQGRQPLFVDPGHFAEFNRDLARRIKTLTEQAPKFDKARERRLKRRVSDLEKDLYRARNDLRALREIGDKRIPNLIRDFELTSVSEARLLMDMLRNDLVRPLRVAPFIDRNLVDNIDQDASDRWYERLERYHRLESVPPEVDKMLQRSRDMTENRRRDADCLTRVAALNRDFQERGIDRRVVLITASEDIHSALAFHERETKFAADDPVQVRRVSQFIPIMNSQDMPNLINRAHATAALETAVDTMLGQARRPGETHEEMLLRLDWSTRGLQRVLGELNRREASEDMSKRDVEALRTHLLSEDGHHLTADVAPFLGRSLDRNLESVLETWTELLSKSINLNIALLVRHFAAQLAGIVETLEELAEAEVGNKIGELSAEFESEQISLTDDVTRAHLSITLSEEISNVSRSLNRRASLIFGSQLQLTSNDDVLTSARGIVSHARAGSLQRTYVAIKELTKLGVPLREILVASAAVALELGAWRTVSNLLQEVRTSQRFNWDAIPATTRANVLWLRACALRAIGYQSCGILDEGKPSSERALLSVFGSATHHLEEARNILADASSPVLIAQERAETAMLSAGKLMLSAVINDQLSGKEVRTIANEGVTAAREALDSASELGAANIRDLSNRPISLLVDGKAAMAVLQIKWAVERLHVDMAGLDAVAFDVYRQRAQAFITSGEAEGAFDLWRAFMKRDYDEVPAALLDSKRENIHDYLELRFLYSAFNHKI